MARAIVLGAGMVGSTIAADLMSDFDVVLADVDAKRLEQVRHQIGAEVVTADLSDAATIGRLVADFDIVLGALPSYLGLAALAAVIRAGKNCCDISFMEEDGTVLTDLAKERGVTAVIDCGVAPGMTNMLAARAVQRFDRCERIDLYVGGIPVERRLPYQYKAGFSPFDVLEEYTRPCTIVEDGRPKVVEALSEIEELQVDGIGTLEAFFTDGLRSLVKNIDVPQLREKTLRYPGSATLLKALRGTGFFSKEEIEVKGVRVRPIDVTAELLFPLWSYRPGEPDLTVLRVAAEGIKDGRRSRYQWDMLDYHDRESDTRSMSRTTAYPATAMARLIASGRFAEPGVHPPEVPARSDELFEFVMAELDRRGVHFSARIEHVDAV